LLDIPSARKDKEKKKHINEVNEYYNILFSVEYLTPHAI
jgi:hypothetical protein